MQLISLFSGIGGFELAAEWMGWDVVASCEINPFGQRVLKHYWPEAYHHDDIHTLNYEKLKTQSRWDSTRPTILTGGFPCQPYSMAGKRRGKEDDRHLWPEMLRVIREIRPDYIVGENVLGLVSWDGGLVFDEVHTDLEREGYEVQAVVIPAAAVNAPHGRDRVWFCARLVADTFNGGHSAGRGASEKENGIQGKNGQTMDAGKSDGTSVSRPTTDTDIAPTEHTIQTGGDLFASCNGEWPTPDTNVNGCTSQRENCQTEGNWSRNNGKSEKWGEPTERTNGLSRLQRDATNTDSNGQQRSDCEYEEQPSKRGINAFNDIEPHDFSNTKRQGSFRMHKTGKANNINRKNSKLWGSFTGSNKKNLWDNFPTQSPICSRNDGLSTKLDGITFSKWRNESIKGAGNAIVPQVAYSIFRCIQSLHQ